MKKRHVLIVEDDYATGMVVADHLRLGNFEVTVAETSAEAKRVLAGTERIDAVLLDHFLPDESGIVLLTAMAHEDALQKPGVVLTSSWVDPQDKNWEEIFSRLPVVAQRLIRAYLPKPYDWNQMDATFETI